MADFKFPDTWLPDRESGTNDVGSTLLGGASSLAPRWDYLLARPQAEESSYAGRRGIAPNVEPPPGSPEYREAQAALAALQAVLPQTKGATAATALAAAGESAWSSGRLASIAARLAPLAAPAAPAAILAASLIALPKIVPGDETIALSGDLRARRPIGQRSVIFERRVDGGLLGTGAGAKWEELPPVDATFGDRMPGRRPVLVDADQLRGSVGTEVADRLLAKGGVIDRRNVENDDGSANRVISAPGGKDSVPPPPISLPSKIEMRIGVSTDGGITTTTREATREEVLGVCPNFARYEGYAIKADANVKPLNLSPQRHGQVVHEELEARLKMDDIQSQLEEHGVYQLKPEIALHRGEPETYDRDHSELDVLELHSDYLTVCIYDYKTGKTPPRLETIYQAVEEVL
jgi:hypothetical protein